MFVRAWAATGLNVYPVWVLCFVFARVFSTSLKLSNLLLNEWTRWVCFISSYRKKVLFNPLPFYWKDWDTEKVALGWFVFTSQSYRLLLRVSRALMWQQRNQNSTQAWFHWYNWCHLSFSVAAAYTWGSVQHWFGLSCEKSSQHFYRGGLFHYSSISLPADWTRKTQSSCNYSLKANRMLQESTS